MESLQARAEEHLRVIRAAMRGTVSFTALPGWGGVIMGAVGVIAALAASQTTDPRQWVVVWLSAAGVAVPVGAFAMWRKASSAGVNLYSGTAGMFVGCLATPIAAGAILTAALIGRQAYVVLPATWLTLYGTAAVVGGAFSVRLVPMMGVAFMVLGALAAFVPLAVGNVLMGAGFGLLHGVVGLVIVRRFGG